MPPIAVGTLVVVDHCKDTGEGKKQKIEEVKEGFVLMKGNLGILNF